MTSDNVSEKQVWEAKVEEEANVGSDSVIDNEVDMIYNGSRNEEIEDFIKNELTNNSTYNMHKVYNSLYPTKEVSEIIRVNYMKKSEILHLGNNITKSFQENITNKHIGSPKVCIKEQLIYLKVKFKKWVLFHRNGTYADPIVANHADIANKLVDINVKDIRFIDMCKLLIQFDKERANSCFLTLPMPFFHKDNSCAFNAFMNSYSMLIRNYYKRLGMKYGDAVKIQEELDRLIATEVNGDKNLIRYILRDIFLNSDNVYDYLGTDLTKNEEYLRHVEQTCNDSLFLMILWASFLNMPCFASTLVPFIALRVKNVIIDVMAFWLNESKPDGRYVLPVSPFYDIGDLYGEEIAEKANKNLSKLKEYKHKGSKYGKINATVFWHQDLPYLRHKLFENVSDCECYDLLCDPTVPLSDIYSHIINNMKYIENNVYICENNVLIKTDEVYDTLPIFVFNKDPQNERLYYTSESIKEETKYKNKLETIMEMYLEDNFIIPMRPESVRFYIQYGRSIDGNITIKIEEINIKTVIIYRLNDDRSIISFKLFDEYLYFELDNMNLCLGHQAISKDKAKYYVSKRYRHIIDECNFEEFQDQDPFEIYEQDKEKYLSDISKTKKLSVDLDSKLHRELIDKVKYVTELLLSRYDKNNGDYDSEIDYDLRDFDDDPGDLDYGSMDFDDPVRNNYGDSLVYIPSSDDDEVDFYIRDSDNQPVHNNYEQMCLTPPRVNSLSDDELYGGRNAFSRNSRLTGGINELHEKFIKKYVESKDKLLFHGFFEFNKANRDGRHWKTYYSIWVPFYVRMSNVEESEFKDDNLNLLYNYYKHKLNIPSSYFDLEDKVLEFYRNQTNTVNLIFTIDGILDFLSAGHYDTEGIYELRKDYYVMCPTDHVINNSINFSNLRKTMVSDHNYHTEDQTLRYLGGRNNKTKFIILLFCSLTLLIILVIIIVMICKNKLTFTPKTPKI